MRSFGKRLSEFKKKEKKALARRSGLVAFAPKYHMSGESQNGSGEGR